MKKSALIIILFAAIINISYAQFIEVPKETKLKSSNLILGFINPKDFSITHSFNISYASFGNASVSLTSYTATLNYNVLKNMRLSADITMQYSPFASISGASNSFNKDFQKSFNGINLSRVSLDYKLAKDMFISINYYNTGNNNFWLNNNNYFNRLYGF